MKKSIACLLLWGAIQLQAQEERTSSFDNTSRNVISGTDLKLIPANKIRLEPEVPQSEMPKFRLDFSTPNFNWNTRKTLMTVKPDIIKEDSKDSIYLSNYLRLGGGNNGHLLGELFLSNRPSALWSYNLSALHLQGNTPINNQMGAQTRIHMGGSRYFDNASLSTELYYHRDHQTYYAQDDSMRNEGKEGVIYDLASAGKTAENYGIHIDYLFLEKRNVPEVRWLNNVQVFQTNALQEELEAQSTLKFLSRNKRFALFGDLAFTYLDFTTRKGMINQNRSNQMFIDFLPRIQFFHKPTKLDVQVGVNLTYNQHSQIDAPPIRVNPYVSLEKGLADLEMTVYGGIDGGLRKNSLRRMHEIMPFYGLDLPVENSFEQINGYIGLKGKISSNSLFYIDFGGNSIANQMMFTSHPTDSAHLKDYNGLNALNVVYNDISTIYFRAGAEYLVGEKLKVSGDIKIVNFGSDNEVWHMPSMQYNASLAFRPVTSLLIEAGAKGMGRRLNQVRIEDKLQETEVAGFTDVYARIDYRFSGKGRIWVQGSNLLGKKYENWYGYPVWGLTVMGGISIGLF